MLDYILKSNTSLSISSIYEFAVPEIPTSLRHRKKKKNHKAKSQFLAIAVPAACLFHVTVMVEARIQGTSPFDTADSCLYREPFEAGMNR